jgi:hypothetical protein
MCTGLPPPSSISGAGKFAGSLDRIFICDIGIVSAPFAVESGDPALAINRTAPALLRTDTGNVPTPIGSTGAPPPKHEPAAASKQFAASGDKSKLIVEFDPTDSEIKRPSVSAKSRLADAATEDAGALGGALDSRMSAIAVFAMHAQIATNTTFIGARTVFILETPHSL